MGAAMLKRGRSDSCPFVVEGLRVLCVSVVSFAAFCGQDGVAVSSVLCG
jgi:hypothetical protein